MALLLSDFMPSANFMFFMTYTYALSLSPSFSNMHASRLYVRAINVGFPVFSAYSNDSLPYLRARL